MQQTPSLARDPFFYVTVLFFIPLTTVLPAILGQFRFMPVLQTISLSLFLAVAVRQRELGPSFILIGLWAVLQFLIIWGLTSLVPLHVEQAIPNGFVQGRGFLEWFHGQGVLPGGSILWRLLESIGVLVGSVVTGGLAGIWLFVRALNLAGFDAGLLGSTIGGTQGFIAGLPFWTLLRLMGYAIFIVVLAEPLLTSNWSPAYYLSKRRIPLLVGTILLLLGLLLELILPNTWRTVFAL